MHNLFVYGTLKRGHGNSKLLAHAEILGMATSVSKYKLLDCGIPFMIESLDENSGACVRGELYRIDDETLARCDRLERHPRLYMRSMRAFKLSDGTLLEAWVYLKTDNDRVWHGEELQPDFNGVVEWTRRHE